MFNRIFGLKMLPVPKDPVTVSGWKTVPIRPVSEPLIPLGLFASYPFNMVHTDAIYAGETSASPYTVGLNGSLLTCFLREGVAKKLDQARRLLPDNYTFVVWDSFRRLECQQSLFDNRFQREIRPGINENEFRLAVEKFVSLPSDESTHPSPHYTGATADLSIIKVSNLKKLEREARALRREASWKLIYEFEMFKTRSFRESQLLPMGTMFDEISPYTSSNYYEFYPEENPEVLKNRRLLHSAMESADFENYEEEWWHFSYEDQFWAKKRGCWAIYGAATLSPENLWWEENVRRGHYHRNLGWVKGREFGYGKLGDLTLSFARSIAKSGLGDLFTTTHPQACII